MNTTTPEPTAITSRPASGETRFVVTPENWGEYTWLYSIEYTDDLAETYHAALNHDPNVTLDELLDDLEEVDVDWLGDTTFTARLPNCVGNGPWTFDPDDGHIRLAPEPDDED